MTPPRPPEFVLMRNGYYFRPDAKGYTYSIAEAGRWPKEEAERFLPAEGVSMHRIPPELERASPGLKPFTTDGCSGGMSWAWKKATGHGPPWEDLCIEHDRHYHAGRGGPEARLKADREFRDAIIARGYPATAWSAYLAVRAFGSDLFPFTWVWGYGRRAPV